MEKPAIFKPLVVGGLALLGVAICGGALSHGERRKVLTRDNGKCQWTGDNTPCNGILEASHNNHTREDIIVNGETLDYNNFKRCLLLCTAHHLKYHQTTPLEDLGLSREANNWAINRIQERLEVINAQFGQS